LDLSKGFLLVEQNSIVFVESDLDFRLPDYIALRFNLQIRHVHRGLLLGTGPLVDPGYWGKLCIPLHNLTDEDYSIPVSEGLFWVEFTRTTTALGSVPGRKPLDKEFWNIEDFIQKAATPFGKPNTRIAIRSSIPVTLTEARKSAELALAKSTEAEKNSADAKTQATRVQQLFTRIGWIGAVVVGIGVLGLWASFIGAIIAYYVALGPRIDQAIDSAAPVTALEAHQDDLVRQIGDLQSEVRQLGEQLEKLSSPPAPPSVPASYSKTVDSGSSLQFSSSEGVGSSTSQQ
jgi:hypothetical protein